MLQTTLSPVERRAIVLRDTLEAMGSTHLPPCATRFLAVLAARPNVTIPFEVLSAQMEEAGYTYTTQFELRNYARHARKALAPIAAHAKVKSSHGMGYRLEITNERIAEALAHG